MQQQPMMLEAYVDTIGEFVVIYWSGGDVCSGCCWIVVPAP